MFYYTKYSSPIGEMTLVSDGSNLNALWMKNQKYFGSGYKKIKDIKVDPRNKDYYNELNMQRNDSLDIFNKTKSWLDNYFDGKNPQLSELSLLPIGSDFRQEVLKLLCEIPYGKTTTYGEIAKQVALKMNKKTMSAQAVGQAIGHNPIGVIIPCHRVIGKDGSLTGYAGGLDKKVWLLKHEGVEIKQK